MSSPGKAYPTAQKEFILRLKPSYNEARARQTTVSTCDPAGWVAKGVQVRLSTVKAVLAEYHRTGPVETPAIRPGGKPGYRVGSAVETVLRHRVRDLHRRGEAVSIRRRRSWLASAGEPGEISLTTRWRT